jgi:hypothetical protein
VESTLAIDEQDLEVVGIHQVPNGPAASVELGVGKSWIVFFSAVVEANSVLFPIHVNTLLRSM